MAVTAKSIVFRDASLMVFTKLDGFTSQKTAIFTNCVEIVSGKFQTEEK
jgi:hypothetical protein